jgi:hypothetical protein
MKLQTVKLFRNLIYNQLVPKYNKFHSMFKMNNKK